MRQTNFFILLFLVLTIQAQQNKTDSLNIYYAIDKYTLTNKQTKKIDDFTKYMTKNSLYL